MALVADHRIATLAAGAITLAAGAILVAIAPRAPLHRAAGLFFGLRGAHLALVAFSASPADLAGRLAVYPLLGIPFAAAWTAHHLAHHFGRRRPARRRWALGAALLAGVAVLTGVYLWDHRPLAWFFPLQFLAYAAIAAAIAREVRRTTPGPSRRALATFMLGFAGEPGFWAANILAQQAAPSYGGPDEYGAAAIAALATVAAALLWPGASAVSRRERRQGAILLAFAVGTGVLVAANAYLSFAPKHVLDPPEANAAWTLWTVGATAYASLRYRLFAMDLRVKAFLRYSSTTLLLGVVFWAASETIERELDAEGWLASLVAAALVGAALWPLHVLTRRIVELLMPGVADTEEYRRRRREDIYLAAVERARRDGFVDGEEREALRLLGRGLGLSGRDMVRLEGGVAPGPGGASG
jgi:hypothetical protein